MNQLPGDLCVLVPRIICLTEMVVRFTFRLSSQGANRINDPIATITLFTEQLEGGRYGVQT
jgi:hypothetical protein